MVNKIIQILNSNNIDTICVTYNMSQKFTVDDSVRIMQDARSACFYIMGQARASKNITALLLLESELPSVLTAVTESFFQGLPIILTVIADNDERLYERVFAKEYCVYRKCDLNNFEFTIQDILNKKISSIIQITYADNQIKFNNNSYIDDVGQSIIYYGLSKYNSENINSYSSLADYGVIAKYLGSLVGGNNAILVIPYSTLIKDMSIFINFFTMHVLSNPKIVVYNVENNSYLNWIAKQGFKIIDSKMKKLSEETEFLSTNYPVILKMEECL